MDQSRLSSREDPRDAWWTGPIVAATAETLPPGHFYVEPYLFDVIGGNSSTPHLQGFALYGLAPRFSVGLLPALTDARGAGGERHARAGDLTFDLQYRLTAANPRKTTPTLAVVVETSIPTAPFDRLRTAGTGSGTGAAGLLLGLYGQQFLWLPNGRILRTRFNLTRTFHSAAQVSGVSVYGTSQGFSGRAEPQDSTMIDVAAEYSVTRRIVLALDGFHEWETATTVTPAGGRAQLVSPSGGYFGVVPAVEYNWNSNEGVIVGTRLTTRGRDRASTVTPVVAYSRFF